MSKTLTEGKDEIAKLVKYFTTNRAEFVAPRVKEDHIRQCLIDPLFEALGWDVSNRDRVAPQYREVVPEPSLEDEDDKRSPDYAFRVGSQVKFYGEAKKLNLRIGRDPGPAKQIRRYGWASNLVLGILTDFEELAVYDCTKAPRPNDKANYRRIMLLKYTEYVDRWQELWDIFSREAVWSGAYDEYAASKRKKGSDQFDADFLRQLDKWRDKLARNIALRNAAITSEQLNAAVQLTIDRIVFLRMAEDRGLEPYQQLLKLCEKPSIFHRFMKDLCRKADDKYNSGLFHFHKEKDVSEEPDIVTPKIAVDDKILKPIIEGLYYENGSNYDFRLMPVEILGTVYERFLGKVIRLTPTHKAKIEKKPEARKAHGVYYTPDYIVNAIVEKTVGAMIEGQSPANLAGKNGKKAFRVLDMACGSGSFLLGAYRCLLEYHLKWYVDHPDQGKKAVYTDTATKATRLRIEEKKRILTTHIFGVDIDPQAVEVSKLSLLLKALEGENNTSLSQQRKLFEYQRALPNLSENIKCGNSLIGRDYHTTTLEFDEKESKAVRAFDWKSQFSKIIKAGGFDCIIGNPPYDVVEKDRKKASWPHTALLQYVRSGDEYKDALGGKLNLYRFFLIRGLKYLKTGGRLGMIVPLSLMADISTAGTRKRVFTSLVEVGADCVPQKDNVLKRVFRDAKLSTVVMAGVAPKGNVKNAPFTIRTYPWNSFNDPYKECEFRLSELAILDKDNLPIPLVDRDNWDLCRKVYGNPAVVRLGEVQGINITRGEINQTTYKEFITSNSRHTRMLKGVEVGRYRENTKLSQGEIQWLDERRFLKAEGPRSNTTLTRIATQRITGVDEKQRIVATIIGGPCYFADSTNSIDVGSDDEEQLKYLLGLLNSRLFQWRFKMTSTNNNVGTNELECMPYLKRDAGHAGRKKLVTLVQKMLSINAQNPGGRLAANKVKNDLNALNEEADALIYQMYGIDDEGIELIEGVINQAKESDGEAEDEEA
ncbi:MAG: N-6 DNA methylase [Planctomycetia bacterium]|nr:N-6 DNA methylase [Planctomycetia bacterium]